MKPVLILGAGINGAAVARDLTINGIPVCIVDVGDVAGGATSRSSRLIHGGLRYLEYHDTALVRESLLERERLLRLAPHFVKPLRLTIPACRRLGGLWAGFIRFSGLARTPLGSFLLKFGRGPRGLIAIKAGLAMYDRLARSDSLPPHSIERSNDVKFGTDFRHRSRWLCSYSDAQLEFPERFVLAMLEDSRRAARENNCLFDVFPWHKVTIAEHSHEVTITPSGRDDSEEHASHKTISPSIIVNATGAWGDRTLKALGLREKTLFAGTKGSHLFTSHQPLIDALNGNGVYAEANDGRLVFILPCAGGVLIGTTDEPFTDSPDNAVASSAEVDCLLQMVTGVFPDIVLTTDDVCMHHAGVRPLPKGSNSSAAAIPRGHSIEETSIGKIPILTLVGGKLTTCRSLAEEVCTRICLLQNQQRHRSTDNRPFPGASSSQQTQPAENELTKLAEQSGLPSAQAATMWTLVGNRFNEVFSDRLHNKGSTEHENADNDSIFGTTIPRQFVRWSIQNEWCTKLEDLVERRLMLIFHSTIHRATLVELARELAESGRLESSQIDDEIERASQRLQKFYGKSVTPD